MLLHGLIEEMYMMSIASSDNNGSPSNIITGRVGELQEQLCHV